MNVLSASVVCVTNPYCYLLPSLFIGTQFFLVVFTFEMLVKIFAKGFFFGKHSYLKDPWDVMDFVVVLLAYIALIPGTGGNSVTAIRSVRLLRPLRTISTNENMKVLVMALLHALPQMGDVLTLLMFMFFVFGLVGLQLFGGRLSQRCFNADGSLDETNPYLCSTGSSEFTCGPTQYCDNYENPNGGVTGFDTILQSFLTVLQCISTEGWTDVMYWVFEAVSYWGVIYFVILMFIGAMFVVELVVAVIVQAYQTSQEQIDLQKFVEDEEQAGVEMATLTTGDESQNGDTTAANTIGTTATVTTVAAFTGNRNQIAPASLFQKNPDTDATVATKETGVDDTDTKSVTDKSEEDVERGLQKQNSLSMLSGNTSFLMYAPDEGEWRYSVFKLVTTSWFMKAAIGIVVLNTLFMMTEHHGQSADWENMLRISNFVFTGLYIFEMVLKITGLGMRGYVSDRFNIFDGIIVVFNVLEIVVAEGLGLNTGSELASLRAFRLLRLFKMAQHWKELNHLLTTVLMSLSSVLNFSVIMMLFVFIYAVLGMQFFAGQLQEDDGSSPRSNFDTFGWSLVTVFQIIGGENWNEVMYTGIDGKGWTATIYFVSLFMFGNYVLLNLFLAILLSHFEVEVDEEDESVHVHDLSDESDGDEEEFASPESHPTIYVNGADVTTKRSSLHSLRNKNKNRDSGHGVSRAMKRRSRRSSQHREGQKLLEEAMKSQRGDDSSDRPHELRRMLSETERNHATQVLINEDDGGQDCLEYASVRKVATPRAEALRANMFRRWNSAPLSPRPSISGNGEQQPITAARDVDHLKNQLRVHEDNKKKQSVVFVDDRALFCCPAGRARSSVSKLVAHPAFNAFILFVIIFSTVLLAMEDPTSDDTSSDLSQFLIMMDYVTTVIFSIEAALKIYAFGFLFHKGAYLRNGWNVLDFFVVVVSIVDLVFSGSGLTFLKALRALRALRPLRLVRRLQGMRVVVESLVKAMPQILNVLLISLLFFVIFGVVGVTMFKGLFYQCESDDDGSILDVDEVTCDGTTGATWKNPAAGNFDNIFAAMLVLFEVSTLEMWPDVLYRAVDVTSVGAAPARDEHSENALYLVVFIIVANFFLTNLFLGVVVDSFNEMKDKLTGFGFLTARQKMWLELKKLFLFAKAKADPTPPETESAARLSLFKVVTSKEFEVFIVGAIIVNILIMSTEHQNMSNEFEWFLLISNWVFSLLFLFEAVAKIIGLGTVQYFSYGWNRFDFTLVVLSIIGFIAYSTGTSILFDFKILRVFRIPRIFRLLKHFEGLKRLVMTLYYALPSLANIGYVLLLFFFIYAVMGMQLFGGTPHADFVTVHANFDNVGLAMLTLFRMSTGESWNGIMHDIMENGTDATSRKLAIPYFISFVVVGSFLILNLFVAVIMENFDDVADEMDEATKKKAIPLSLDDLQDFSRGWDKYAEHDPWYKFWGPSKSQWLEASKLEAVFLDVMGPMGLGGRKMNSAERLRWIDTLNVPVYEKTILTIPPECAEDGVSPCPVEERVYYVHYFETMVAVAYHTFKSRTNALYRRRVRHHVKIAGNLGGFTDEDEYWEKSGMENLNEFKVNDDDEIDAIPKDMEAYMDIQHALERKVKKLDKIEVSSSSPKPDDFLDSPSRAGAVSPTSGFSRPSALSNPSQSDPNSPVSLRRSFSPKSPTSPGGNRVLKEGAIKKTPAALSFILHARKRSDAIAKGRMKSKVQKVINLTAVKEKQDLKSPENVLSAFGFGATKPAGSKPAGGLSALAVAAKKADKSDDVAASPDSTSRSSLRAMTKRREFQSAASHESTEESPTPPPGPKPIAPLSLQRKGLSGAMAALKKKKSSEASAPVSSSTPETNDGDSPSE